MNVSLISNIKTLKNDFIKEDIILSSKIQDYVQKIWFLTKNGRNQICVDELTRPIEESKEELTIDGGKIIIEPFYPKIYCPYCHNNPFELKQYDFNSYIELENQWKDKCISACCHEVYIGGLIQRIGKND
ncbi:MAG: hypothetical protein ACTSPV_03720 [Candidatus Hodarchaeales archaeon]